MKFTFALIALASLATSFAAGPFDTIRADIADIHIQVTSLDKTINALPNTQANVKDLAVAAKNLVLALNKGTADAANIASLTAAEAQVVTNDVQSFVPEVEHALRVIVLKHAAFPVGSLALAGQTLRAIDNSARNFGDALIKNAKPNVLNQATAIKVGLVAKFQIAEAAFPV